MTRIGRVTLNADTIRDSLEHTRYANKFDSVPAIPDVLERGAYLGNLMDKDGRQTNNHCFAGLIRLGGEEKILFVRVRRTSGRKKAFYVHEIFTHEEVAASEQWSNFRNAAANTTKASDAYRSILARFLGVNENQFDGGERHTISRSMTPPGRRACAASPRRSPSAWGGSRDDVSARPLPAWQGVRQAS